MVFQFLLFSGKLILPIQSPRCKVEIQNDCRASPRPSPVAEPMGMGLSIPVSQSGFLSMHYERMGIVTFPFGTMKEASSV